MKTPFAFALALSAFATAEAAPLLETVHYAGFEQNPQTKTFVVEDSGEMTLTVHDRRQNKRQVLSLGRLSEYATKRIAQKAAAIDVSLPLQDNKEGEPLCMDAPEYSTTAYIKGQPKEISRSSGCHEWSLASYEAQELASFASVFLHM